MRSIPTNMQAQLDRQYASEPLIVVKIDWPVAGSVYYADKATSFGSVDCLPYILDLDNIATQLKEAALSEVSSVKIKLDDLSGGLKEKVNTEVIEGTMCTIYQHFHGNSSTDAVVLFKGSIAGDITWSEGDRSLAFTVESVLGAEEVGFAPDANFIEGISKAVIDNPLPLCFGSCVRVPAIKLVGDGFGTLSQDVCNVSNGKDLHTQMQVIVDGGEDQPQGVLMDIYIAGIKFTGSFAQKVFNVTVYNAPYHTHLTVGGRVTEDDDTADASVFWLADDDVSLLGLSVQASYNSETLINKCVNQVGRKCFFEGPWVGHNEYGDPVEVLLDAGAVLLNVAGSTDLSWVNGGYNYYYYNEDGRLLPRPGVIGYNIPAGSVVSLVGNPSQVYVPNCIPSTGLYEVMAEFTAKGITKLTPIPSSYYSYNLSQTISGRAITTITFPRLLSKIWYPDELEWSWSDEIFVTLRSSVGNNTADIISWIITNYSDLSVDAASFAAAKTKLTPFPSNFALFDMQDAIQLCEDIAWQARCSLVIRGGTVYLKYMSEVPTAVATLDETVTILKSLNLSYTSTEEAITQYTAIWRKDYQGAEQKFVYANNIDIYGVAADEKDFFIYNIRSLAELSARFWGYRKSNSWRRLDLTAILKTLAVEPFDCVSCELDDLSTNAIRGIVQTANYDSADPQIAVSLELASKSGGNTDGQPIEDLTYFTGGLDYPTEAPVDPTTGLSIVVPDPWWFILGDKDKEEEQLELEFTTEPMSATRGEYFNLAVRLKNSKGEKVSKSFDCNIWLKSSDDDDGISVTKIRIRSGSWSGQVAITGGDGNNDYGYITVAHDTGETKYLPTRTGTFNITSDDAVYGFTSVPGTVTRDESFTVTGTGEEGDGKAIFLESSDGDDAMGSVVMWFGANDAGSVTPTITGGEGQDSGRLYMVLNGNRIYSPRFTIEDAVEPDMPPGETNGEMLYWWDEAWNLTYGITAVGQVMTYDSEGVGWTAAITNDKAWLYFDTSDGTFNQTPAVPTGDGVVLFVAVDRALAWTTPTTDPGILITDGVGLSWSKPTNKSMLYYNDDAFQWVTGVGMQVLISSVTGDPVWSTPTPGDFLWCTAAGGIQWGTVDGISSGSGHNVYVGSLVAGGVQLQFRTVDVGPNGLVADTDGYDIIFELPAGTAANQLMIYDGSAWGKLAAVPTNKPSVLGFWSQGAAYGMGWAAANGTDLSILTATTTTLAWVPLASSTYGVLSMTPSGLSVVQAAAGKVLIGGTDGAPAWSGAFSGNYQIPYSLTNSLAWLAAPTGVNQILASGTSNVPGWSTAGAAKQILYGTTSGPAWITAPSAAGALGYDGTNFVWRPGATADYTGANKLKVANGLTCDGDGNVVQTFKYLSMKVTNGVLETLSISDS